MKKPIIGLTPSQKEGMISMRANYLSPVWQSGGVPSVLPQTEDPAAIASYCDTLDGLLFTGGADVDPRYYGEKICSPTVEVTPCRDSFELALFRAFIQTGKPIFGICRGIQLINVALGGSLQQHIDNHRQTEPGTYPHHEVIAAAGSRLSLLCGQKTAVNSFHHQAVKVPAPGVCITAHSADGTAEALELPDYPFLMAVQWHPEISYTTDPASKALFDAFIFAASQNFQYK